MRIVPNISIKIKHKWMNYDLKSPSESVPSSGSVTLQQLFTKSDFDRSFYLHGSNVIIFSSN